MTDGSPLPVAGWYDDPELALQLRWWDGQRWTHHRRPRLLSQAATPQASDPEAQGVPGGQVAGSTIAAPTQDEPYGYSVPHSFTPASAPAASNSLDDTEQRATPLGTFGSRTVSHHDVWSSTSTSMDYTPERTTTTSAWMIALTPVVAYLAQLAVTVLTGLDSTPWFWILAAGVLPILWIVVFVVRDRQRLHEWGHLQRASAWWALLGNIGYLTARGIVVSRQARGGWWPLVLTLALTALFVSLGIFTPALFLVFRTPM